MSPRVHQGLINFLKNKHPNRYKHMEDEQGGGMGTKKLEKKL